MFTVDYLFVLLAVIDLNAAFDIQIDNMQALRRIREEQEKLIVWKLT
jgi:hypothetical protein